MKYLIFFITVFFSVNAWAQYAEEGSYDPTRSPQNNFLYRQLHETEPASRSAINPEIFYQQRMLKPKQQRVLTDDETSVPFLIKEEKPQPSRLEAYYSERANETLNQFGYDLFKNNDEIAKQPQQRTQPIGAQENYILGQGDRLLITFTGEKQSRDLFIIDQQGQLVFDDMPPILATGKTIQALRQEINALLSASYHNTEIFISLEGIKDISVSVIGEVEKPGRYIVSSYASLMDVLQQAEGIKKTGSLRHIKRLRGADTQSIDLYDIILGQNTYTDLSLRDGDRIIVPTLSKTIAITGEVSRQGIYELSQKTINNPKVTLEEALSYAGDALAAGQNRVILNSIDRDGAERITQLNIGTTTLIKNGDIVKVERMDVDQRDGITLVGAIRHTGIHALTGQDTLAQLLGNSRQMMPDTYPFIGLIDRYNPKTLSREMIAFSPKKVLEGVANEPLLSKDRILIFSRNDLQDIIQFETSQNHETEIESEDTALTPETHIKPKTEAKIDKNTIELTPEIEKILADHTVSLRGAVTLSGNYPIIGNTSLQDILDYAGGLSYNADITRIEVTNQLVKKDTNRTKQTLRRLIDLEQEEANTVLLNPKDTIRVHENFVDLKGSAHAVRITGEVLYPGYYDLARDETLLDLINRAGGLTETAYPEGAIFSREFERKRESQEFKNQALEIERSIAASLSEKEPHAEEISFLKATVERLNSLKPTGRITVEADPAILSAKPAQNILLEPGDHIFIPKRAITVRVTGEVLSPTVLQFKSQKTAKDYINEAGGMTRNADRGKAYVIFPDGSARPLESLSWASTSSATKILPMSTIYVPRDPKPFDFLQTTRDFTQILTNLAITGIFLDDISND
ncbi:MAG: polysaccharide biosynthesis/export family protein [Micavibrio sp.]|nr:polysaccharide biosynthesis/export family protein [Micavibrio sp.]